MTCRSFWQRANHRLPTLVFVATNGRGDSMHVKIMCLANGFSNLVQAFNDRVSVLHGVLPGGNSSGVQMTGGTNPAERHVASMVLRMVAFARCLQFHVRR